MKELSTEEKAKAYDKALEKAQKWYDANTNEGYRGIFEDIFPELKESEDERIRKGLIKFVSAVIRGNDDAELSGVLAKDCLAWLEKQGEKPKKVSLWKHWKDGIAGNSEGKLIYLVKMDNTYRLTSCLGFECDYIELTELDKLLSEKQGEQEPVEFKPSFRVGDVIKPKDPVLGEPRIIVGIHPNFGYDTNNGILDFEFEDNWELVEQKPAWSEEDEKMLQNAIFFIEFYRTEKADTAQAEATFNWLKSLRPQNTWKPSDEQIKVCKEVYADILSAKGFDLGTVNGELNRLEAELKKLKE